MKIILRNTVDSLGVPGEIINVKDGYARNFLIPRGLAEQATKGNIDRLQKELEKRAELEAIDISNLEELTERLNKLTLKFELKAGEEGKLFGSVTSQMIAEEITAKGYEIDKKIIEIPEAIKHEGNHFVNVKLDKGYSGRIKVKVKGIKAE